MRGTSSRTKASPSRPSAFRFARMCASPQPPLKLFAGSPSIPRSKRMAPVSCRNIAGERRRFQDHACAIDRRLQRHRRAIEPQATGGLDTRCVLLLQPLLPGQVGLHRVNEPGRGELTCWIVFLLAQQDRAVGRAEWQDRILHDDFREEPWPGARTVAKIEIHILLLELREFGRCVDMQIPQWIALDEAGNSRAKPANAEAGRHPKDETAGFALAHDLLSCISQNPKRFGGRLRRALAFSGEHQRPLDPTKEPDPERLFQGFDLLAHGRRRDQELFGRSRHPGMPGRSFEIDHGVQRKASHLGLFIRLSLQIVCVHGMFLSRSEG